jgi:hypothetical protein
MGEGSDNGEGGTLPLQHGVPILPLPIGVFQEIVYRQVRMHE